MMTGDELLRAVEAMTPDQRARLWRLLRDSAPENMPAPVYVPFPYPYQPPPPPPAPTYPYEWQPPYRVTWANHTAAAPAVPSSFRIGSTGSGT